MAMGILNKIFLKKIVPSLLFIIIFIAGITVAKADDRISQKQKVIAGAIYKFMAFITWDSSLNTQTSFNLCLLQHDSAFEPFKNRHFQNKPIKVLLFDGKNKQDHCHVLYLNTATQSTTFINNFKNKPILTISQNTGFINQGGIIELEDYNNRLAFSINLLAAKNNNLNIAFQLLSLASKVIEN
jgi:hypothetical protein